MGNDDYENWWATVNRYAEKGTFWLKHELEQKTEGMSKQKSDMINK